MDDNKPTLSASRWSVHVPPPPSSGFLSSSEAVNDEQLRSLWPYVLAALLARSHIFTRLAPWIRAELWYFSVFRHCFPLFSWGASVDNLTMHQYSWGQLFLMSAPGANLLVFVENANTYI